MRSSHSSQGSLYKFSWPTSNSWALTLFQRINITLQWMNYIFEKCMKTFTYANMDKLFTKIKACQNVRLLYPYVHIVCDSFNAMFWKNLTIVLTLAEYWMNNKIQNPLVEHQRDQCICNSWQTNSILKSYFHMFALPRIIFRYF